MLDIDGNWFLFISELFSTFKNFSQHCFLLMVAAVWYLMRPIRQQNGKSALRCFERLFHKSSVFLPPNDNRMVSLCDPHILDEDNAGKKFMLEHSFHNSVTVLRSRFFLRDRFLPFSTYSHSLFPLTCNPSSSLPTQISISGFSNPSTKEH
jgi:hypothetical protein